jgi:GH25 family lysozyme M1 (1,4-beta-N-acetylmuramidase)
MDVSAYQGVLTETYGYSFIFVKATEGMTFKDPNFTANWKFLGDEVKAGRLTARGAYHFFHPSIGPGVQATFFLDTVEAEGLEPGDVLMNDSELLSGSDDTLVIGEDVRSHELMSGPRGVALIRPGASDYAPESASGTLVPLSATDLDLANKAFLDAVMVGAAERLGGPHVRVINYCDGPIAAQLKSCTNYPLVIADYSDTAPASVEPWKTWTFWQWAGGGAPDGGDRDAFNGTVAELKAWVDAVKVQVDKVKVPAVEGLRVMAEAVPKLEEAGFTYKVTPDVDKEYPNVVVSQTPGAGEEAVKGSRVDLGIRAEKPV